MANSTEQLKERLAEALAENERLRELVVKFQKGGKSHLYEQHG